MPNVGNRSWVHVGPDLDVGNAFRAPVALAGGGGLTFLLRDDFTTDEAAPLDSPRSAEPGPGTLTLVQTDGQFSISGGKLAFPAQSTPAWGDQGFYGAQQARLAGRATVGNFNISDVSFFGFGWKATADVDFSPSGGDRWGFVVTTNGTINASAASTAGFAISDANGVAEDTDYRFAIVQRGAGVFTFIKGGLFTEWTLLWVSASGTGSLYSGFGNFGAAGTLSTFRVLDLGGDFATDYGLATDRLAGSVSAGTTFTHEADCVIEWTQTTVGSSGNTRLAFRMQDELNFWEARISSAGTITLNEFVAGSPTSRGSASTVVTDGHRIVVVADGSTIRVYSNNVLRITYASASAYATETDGELIALTTGGAVSDIITWPRTISGAAANLLNQAAA